MFAHCGSTSSGSGSRSRGSLSHANQLLHNAYASHNSRACALALRYATVCRPLCALPPTNVQHGSFACARACGNISTLAGRSECHIALDIARAHQQRIQFLSDGRVQRTHSERRIVLVVSCMECARGNR